MEGIPIDPEILQMSRWQILREFMDFAKRRHLNLPMNAFAKYGLPRLQSELFDLRRHSTNSWLEALAKEAANPRPHQTSRG